MSDIPQRQNGVSSVCTAELCRNINPSTTTKIQSVMHKTANGANAPLGAGLPCEHRPHARSHLSRRRHWKCMEESSSSTPVLSGSCLHSCMQCRSAASKSPDWYSRCASSANPWKESKRLVGSGAPKQPGEETIC